MEWIEQQINWLENAIKELDELMFCLTSQKQINRAIEERDAFEEALGNFTRVALNEIASLNEFIIV